MAPDSSQNRPSRHYASQAGLATAFAAIIRREWRGLDRVRLYALLVQFSKASASIAADDYTARRLEAGIRSGFTVPHAAPPTLEHLDNTLNWVYADPAAVEQRMEAAVTRLAVQTGRETTVEAVMADRQARAWARETRPGCCSFCAMLATRGAIYRSEESAGRDANDALRIGKQYPDGKFTGDGLFKFHNNCHCIAVPVFGVYEKTAEARTWTRQWHDLKRELGHSPSLNQWRQKFEGRPVDGLEDPQERPAEAGN